MKKLTSMISLLVLLVCSACKDQGSLQRGYVDARDECRARSEDRVQMYTQPEAYGVSGKEKNAALLFLFCECMKERDWNVVGCKDAHPPAPTAVASAAPPAGPYTPPPGYALVPMVAPVPNVSPSAGSALEPSLKDRVFFDYNRAVINSDGQKVLQRQAEWLRQHPNVNVLIEGHCDERGTREYNLALGARRATAVKNYMTSLGVEPHRMEVISFGKERPEAIGDDAATLEKNRRSVTVLPTTSQ